MSRFYLILIKKHKKASVRSVFFNRKTKACEAAAIAGWQDWPDAYLQDPADACNISVCFILFPTISNIFQHFVPVLCPVSVQSVQIDVRSPQHFVHRVHHSGSAFQ